MKKIGFQTLGCKVNIYESNALKNELAAKGYEIVEPSADCDAFIVNTCSVTNMADAKSRKIIRRMHHLNPEAVLCVMGCYAQTNPEAMTIDGIDILVGTGNKKEVIELLEEKFLDMTIQKKIHLLDIANHHEYEKLEVTTYDHARAFVKIEDGCENFCSYCIIPYARGPIRCKPADEVIEELKRITEKGFKEIVLAGIHTGKYRDRTTNLSSLIARILKEVPLLERLRLSSIEINEIDDDFLALLKTSSKLADHLHLPLQSGSDLILKKMERRYDTAFFKEKIRQIRQVRPDISLSTDIIVGFPYESENEFNETVRFAEEIRFSKIHVFPYSMREKTKAVSMPQVDSAAKRKRASALLAVSDRLECAYRQQFLHKTLTVLAEQRKGEYLVGHTENYLEVWFKGEDRLLKKIVPVVLDDIKNNHLIGHLLDHKLG